MRIIVCFRFIFPGSILLDLGAAFTVFAGPACLRKLSLIDYKDPDPDYGSRYADSYEEFELVSCQLSEGTPLPRLKYSHTWESVFLMMNGSLKLTVVGLNHSIPLYPVSIPECILSPIGCPHRSCLSSACQAMRANGFPWPWMWDFDRDVSEEQQQAEAARIYVNTHNK